MGTGPGPLESGSGPGQSFPRRKTLLTSLCPEARSYRTNTVRTFTRCTVTKAMALVCLVCDEAPCSSDVRLLLRHKLLCCPVRPMRLADVSLSSSVGKFPLQGQGALVRGLDQPPHKCPCPCPFTSAPAPAPEQAVALPLLVS